MLRSLHVIFTLFVTNCIRQVAAEAMFKFVEDIQNNPYKWEYRETPGCYLFVSLLWEFFRIGITLELPFQIGMSSYEFE